MREVFPTEEEPRTKALKQVSSLKLVLLLLLLVLLQRDPKLLQELE
jgi:hypothetical protein